MPGVFKLLIVEDDKIAAKLLISKLVHDFQLELKDNGAQAIAWASTEQPDIILLDIELPDMTGYEICDHLKRQPSTAHIPICFFSSRESLREKMIGYESGADDYLIKSTPMDEVKIRLNVLARRHEGEIAKTQQISVAAEVAKEALTSTSEMGQAMQFIEYCMAATSYEQISKHFFKLAAGLDVKTILLMETPIGFDCFSSEGVVKPLERELIARLKTEKRFTDFGTRTQINYPKIALLIKNMPIEDRERYGRYKDLFPAVLGAMNAKIQSLESKFMMKDQLSSLGTSFEEINTSLNELSSNIEKNQQKSIQLMRKLLHELTNELPSMGLEEDQEVFLLDKIDRSIEEASGNMDIQQDVQIVFQHILHKLQNLISEFRDANNRYDDQSANQLGEEEDITSVELF
jgi:DNA-binding response OmpR family regulator